MFARDARFDIAERCERGQLGATRSFGPNPAGRGGGGSDRRSGTMKMEVRVTAPVDGIVRSIGASPGQIARAGQRVAVIAA
jgi:Biotin-requiring enzyme